ncbi:hypothetical protein NPIL_682861, partial [Nephila pilipes]
PNSDDNFLGIEHQSAYKEEEKYVKNMKIKKRKRAPKEDSLKKFQEV